MNFWKRFKYIRISKPLLKGNDNEGAEYFEAIKDDGNKGKNLWADDVSWDK